MTEGYETTEEGFEKLQERAAGRDRAHLAIDGLLPDEVTHKLDAMESLYQREMEREASARKTIAELNQAYTDLMLRPWWFGRKGELLHVAMLLNIEYAELLQERIDPIAVLRAMITDLAHAYQTKVADLRVMPIIEARAAEYVKLKARHDDLAQFLMNEFPADHKLGAVNGRDNFDIAMAVMANYKHRVGEWLGGEVKS